MWVRRGMHSPPASHNNNITEKKKNSDTIGEIFSTSWMVIPVFYNSAVWRQVDHDPEEDMDLQTGNKRPTRPKWKLRTSQQGLVMDSTSGAVLSYTAPPPKP